MRALLTKYGPQLCFIQLYILPHGASLPIINRSALPINSQELTVSIKQRLAEISVRSPVRGSPNHLRPKSVKGDDILAPAYQSPRPEKDPWLG